jgi:squalene cyclase
MTLNMRTPKLRPPQKPEGPNISSAMQRAADSLRRTQRADGSWACDTDIGPIGVATQLLVEDLFGALPSTDRPLARAYFASCQRRDGSFEYHPHAGIGCPATTALCWAALRVCAADEEDDVASRAKAYLDSSGGLETVMVAFRERGEIAPLYLLAHGLVDASFLPKLPTGVALAPLGSVLDRRFHTGNIILILVISALQQRHGPVPEGFFGKARLAVEQLRIRQSLLHWQNADGSWNGSPLQTTLMLLGLHAAGATKADVEVQRALDWLDGMKRRGQQLDVCAMDNDVWSTALCALALHAADEPGSAVSLDKAQSYLLSTQSREPMPRANQRKANAKRTGGWPFQKGNETMPDTDDTGVVIAALSTLAGERATRPLFNAIDEGVDWLRDMQNPDGGFPTFVWGLPSKAPGPMFVNEMRMELDDPKAMFKSLVQPQAEYGDPSLAGVTGRVLWGLGCSGVQRSDPAVCRAIDFLRAQQCESGAWWGRWKTCYLAATATTLLGLAAVGEDMSAAYVQRALRWVLSCQNEDGGFGELPGAYNDPLLAGQGPSMPPVTAYVMLGCLAAERLPAEAMERAGSYLLTTQKRDGTWSNENWLHTFIPPRLMYVYEMPAYALPVLALAELRKCRAR